MSLDAGEYGNGAYFHKSPEDALRFATMPSIGFFNRPPQRHTAPIQHHRPTHNGSFPGAFNEGFGPFHTHSKGNGQLMLIQARVVTGEWIQGRPYLRAAPYKNPLQQFGLHAISGGLVGGRYLYYLSLRTHSEMMIIADENQ